MWKTVDGYDLSAEEIIVGVLSDCNYNVNKRSSGIDFFCPGGEGRKRCGENERSVYVCKKRGALMRSDSASGCQIRQFSAAYYRYNADRSDDRWICRNLYKKSDENNGTVFYGVSPCRVFILVLQNFLK